MTTFDLIEEQDLSRAWARAVRPMLGARAQSEIAPICVSITGFDRGVVRESGSIRKELDAVLVKAKKQNCHTVANTIFPDSLWNPTSPRSLLFDRFKMSLPRIKSSSTKNRHGTYFERLIAGGPVAHPNQLDFVIDLYLRRKGVRRSALQVGVYNPQLDLTGSALRGFPCLQHLTFAPVGKGLNLNAFYATQYAFERAYGNYLGLCRLGRFVAHELKLELVRVTCFTGIMLRDEKIDARAKQRIAKVVDAALDRTKGAE
jgi:hypothetical protein